MPEVRLTHQQNVLLPWIPNDRVEALLAEPLAQELSPQPELFTRGLQTCTGKEFCGLAKVHTKDRAAEIARFLDAHVVKNGHGEDFRLHFAGCSSSCAQHQIADVGIEGVLKKVDGEFIEAMDIRIGGRLGPDPRFGDVVLKKVPALGPRRDAAADLLALRDQPRRGRDVPRLRGPHPARVVDRAAHARGGRGLMTAEAVIADAVERFHPRVALACSFQKEETVLLDLLFKARPGARVFALDTRVLFDETYEYWEEVEERYGTRVEVFAAEDPPDRLWESDPAGCCGIRKVTPLKQALERARRVDHRHAARAVADALGHRGDRLGRQARAVEVQPAGGLDRARRVVVHRRSRAALPPAARRRVRLDRLHALHAARERSRGSLGGEREDRVRPARLSHLDHLESEAVHVMREVAAERERPALLFSGGKDSIVLLRLAEKAFRPGRFPFPLLHVDTGHNFPEVLEFRDRRVAELGEELIVASVQESIDSGRVVEERGPRASRNRLQTTTLLDAIEAHRFDACFGGARRDEERARAKERVISLRDDFGGWDPRRQRPELWDLYNTRVGPGEHLRVFPLSNWTELDVWQYILRERDRGPVDLPGPRARRVRARRDAAGRLRARRAASTARRSSPSGCATARSAT